MPLSMEVGLGPSDFVFGGDIVPCQKKAHPPNLIFGPCLLGKTAGSIDMPLSTEVKLGPGDVVFDGFAAVPIKGAQPPVFGSCLLWPNGWMDEDATLHGRPRPRPHCVRRGPSSPAKGAQQPPLPLWPMSIMPTVAHLLSQAELLFTFINLIKSIF